MSDQLQQLAEQIIANAPEEWREALRQVYDSAKGGSLAALELAQSEEAEEADENEDT